jgi:hypothetical protein
MSSIQQWTTALKGLDSLQLSEAAKPTPAKGEVLVEIRAVSLNYRDYEGKSTRLSRIPYPVLINCSLQRRVQSSPIRQPGQGRACALLRYVRGRH